MHSFQKHLVRSVRRGFLALGTALVACLPNARGISFADVQFGGFISQGYLVNTGSNDYLGETSEGTFDFREYAANASYSTNSLRFGAQVFGQKLGVYGDDEIKVDWASVDWQPAQWFGLRVGRVKTPRGLYNEALDVDAIRPYVLLPQSVYDARLRDFNASFDGAMVFGNVSAGRAGSIDYKVYYGGIPIKLGSGANDYFNNDFPFPNTDIGIDYALGFSFIWNTPVVGLRVGYSASTFRDFFVDRVVVVLPGQPLFRRNMPDYYRNLLSAEYFVGDWTLAAEVGRDDADSNIGPSNDPFQSSGDTETVYGYVSASRRFGSDFEIGAYYSYSKEEFIVTTPTGRLDNPTLKQHDYAVSVKYSVNDNWLVKAEVHYLDGAGKLFNTPANPSPVDSRDNSWVLFAAKTTFSF